MKPAYYQEYYHLEREHWWFKARENILFTHLKLLLPPGQRSKILNIGAATGRTSEWLMELGEVKSIEYDPDCYEFTRLHVGIDIIQASALDLPYDTDSFDLVCAFDVLEHIEDHALAIQEIKRVYKPTGLVSITVPAFQFLWNQHDDVNHHMRRYRLPQLVDLFKDGDDQGEVRYKSYFNFWLFFPIAVFRMFSKLRPSRHSRRTDAGSNFYVMNGGFYQRFFYWVFNAENWFIKRKIYLPIGLSVLLTWRKKADFAPSRVSTVELNEQQRSKSVKTVPEFQGFRPRTRQKSLIPIFLIPN